MVLQPHSLPQREVKHVLRSPACLPSSGEVAKPKVLTEGFSPRKGSLFEGAVERSETEGVNSFRLGWRRATSLKEGGLRT